MKSADMNNKNIEREKLFRLLETFASCPHCLVKLAEEPPSGGHTHRHWELMLPRLNREAEFTVAILNPPGVRHATMFDRPSNGSLSCQVRPNFFSCRFQRQEFVPPVQSADLNDLLISYCEFFRKAVEAGVTGSELSRLSAALITTLLFVLQQLMRRDYAPQKLRTIQLAANYIIQHAIDPAISVEEIADALGVTPAHLSRIFRNEVGMTTRRFLVETRLRLARELLQDGRYCVADIARMTGWRSAAYFTAVFTRINGDTPSAFARRAHGGRIISRRIIREDMIGGLNHTAVDKTSSSR